MRDCDAGVLCGVFCVFVQGISGKANFINCLAILADADFKMAVTHKFDSSFKNAHLQAIMKQNNSLKVILYGAI